MPDIDPTIRDHYTGNDERNRLAAGAGLLEFVRTQQLLARVLPDAPAVILDVGGAAGVHAGPLAAQGYEVHLIDPVPWHIEQARALPGLASATLGEARALEWPDATVDAVLLLGPLYHLTERADRVRALAEARSVLRPGGVVAAAAVSRYASTLDGLFRGHLRDRDFEAIVERDVAEGQHRNPDNVPGWFTTAYFHRPEDLADEAADAGLGEIDVVVWPAVLLATGTMAVEAGLLGAAGLAVVNAAAGTLVHHGALRAVRFLRRRQDAAMQSG